MPPTWPLVGRGRELRLVDEAVEGRHRLKGVVLAGAAGVGKTRLAREAGATAAARGAMCEWAVPTASGATVPLAALAHLVPFARLPGGPLRVMQATARDLVERAG